MLRLLYTGLTTIGAGIVAFLIAWMTWPKNSFYASDSDFTGPTAFLIVGSALVSLGIIGILLWMHAEAVEEATMNALTRHEENIQQRERDRQRREQSKR